jgi:hypothetical protein
MKIQRYNESNENTVKYNAVGAHTCFCNESASAPLASARYLQEGGLLLQVICKRAACFCNESARGPLASATNLQEGGLLLQPICKRPACSCDESASLRRMGTAGAQPAAFTRLSSPARRAIVGLART